MPLFRFGFADLFQSVFLLFTIMDVHGLIGIQDLQILKYVKLFSLDGVVIGLF